MAKNTHKGEATRDYAEAIVETVREPLVVLNGKLRVLIANRSFYKIFRVTKKETEHKLIYNLGNGQWDNPKLRHLLDLTKRSFKILKLAMTFPLLENALCFLTLVK